MRFSSCVGDFALVFGGRSSPYLEKALRSLDGLRSRGWAVVRRYLTGLAFCNNGAQPFPDGHCLALAHRSHDFYPRPPERLQTVSPLAYRRHRIRGRPTVALEAWGG